MPEAATEFGKLKDHVHTIAHDMDSTHSSAKQTSDALGNILKSLLAVEVAVKGISYAATFSPMASAFKEAIASLGKTSSQLREMHYSELEHAKRQRKSGEITKAQLAEIKKQTRAREPLIQAQLKLEEEINKVGAIRLGVLTLTVAAVSRLFYLNQDFNDSLIKSNSSLRARTELFYTNLRIQQETGTAFKSITEAQRELINYGFQNQRNYYAILTTVVKLHESLGMSVQEATQLAVVTERQVKVAFKDTADVVAGLVDSTSLAADEVGRLAINLARAMAVIKPGGVQEFPQIVQLVGKYEDALKKFGGQVGQFEQLITRMTKPEGLLSAGVLGVSNPEQLLKTAGVDKAIDNFYKYAVSQLAGAKGFDRMFRLDILAEQFGTTAEQVNAMIQAIEDAKKAQSGEITLQERFRQQMQATGDGFKRIGNSLMALAQMALYPAVVLVNWLAGAIANLLQTIVKYRPLAYAASAAIGLGILAVIAELKKAAIAFWEVAMAARLAAASLRQQAAASALQSGGAIAGGAVAAGAAGEAGIFARILGGLKAVMSPIQTVLVWGFNAIRIILAAVTAPLAAIAIGIAGGLVIWSYLKRMAAKSMEETLATNAKLVTMQGTYLDTAKTQIYTALRGGDSGRAQEVIDRALKSMHDKRGAYGGMSDRQVLVEQAKFSKDLQKLVPLAQYTATQFGNLRVTPEENVLHQKESTDLQQKIADNTKKSIDEAHKMRDQENRQADEEQRQTELRYMRSGGVMGRGAGIYGGSM